MSMLTLSYLSSTLPSAFFYCFQPLTFCVFNVILTFVLNIRNIWRNGFGRTVYMLHIWDWLQWRIQSNIKCHCWRIGICSSSNYGPSLHTRCMAFFIWELDSYLQHSLLTSIIFLPCLLKILISGRITIVWEDGTWLLKQSKHKSFNSYWCRMKLLSCLLMLVQSEM